MSRPDGRANRSTVTLHAVCSLDGFIARDDNTLSWLETSEMYDKGASEDSAMDVVKAIDCYLLGARTYEHALELGWPYGDTPTMVVTSRQLPAKTPGVEFYAGDLTQLVEERLAPRFRNIWLVGGADLCQRFLELGLVDHIRLTIAPVLLGKGLRLFGRSETETRWRMKGVEAYRNGFAELWYEAL